MTHHTLPEHMLRRIYMGIVQEKSVMDMVEYGFNMSDPLIKVGIHLYNESIREKEHHIDIARGEHDEWVLTYQNETYVIEPSEWTLVQKALQDRLQASFKKSITTGEYVMVYDLHTTKELPLLRNTTMDQQFREETVTLKSGKKKLPRRYLFDFLHCYEIIDGI